MERKGPPTRSAAPASGRWLFRQPLPVRLTHWINALCLLVLAISGFQILTGAPWVWVGRWHHFFFAWIFVFNGFFYTAYALWSGHLFRDLLPRWKDLRKIGPTLRDHLLFRYRKKEEEIRYNVLQKIAYTGVVFGLGSLILLTGLVMSPRGEAAFPDLLTLFGSKRRARVIHLNVTFLFIAYTSLHLLMVALTGFRNNVRSMITGWYRTPSSLEESEKQNKDRL
jgi:thiosulfate reductase cytochrome b subunit